MLAGSCRNYRRSSPVSIRSTRSLPPGPVETPLLKRSRQDYVGFALQSTHKHLMLDPCPLHSNHAANRKALRPGQTPRAARTSPGGRSSPASPRRPTGKPPEPWVPRDDLPSRPPPCQERPSPRRQSHTRFPPVAPPPPRSAAVLFLGRAGLRRERACALAAGRLPRPRSREVTLARAAADGRPRRGREGVCGRKRGPLLPGSPQCSVGYWKSRASPPRPAAPLWPPALADTVAHPPRPLAFPRRRPLPPSSR